MHATLTIGGRRFSPELIGELKHEIEENPEVSARSLAQLIWSPAGLYSGNGQMAVAVRKAPCAKLRRRGLLPPAPIAPVRRRRRLKAFG